MAEIKAKITVGEGWYEGMEGEEFGVLYFEGKDAMIDPEDAPRQRFLRDGTYEIVSEENTQAPSPNMVDSPPHYQNARFETIEVIEEITAGYSDGFVAYSVGNALKYLARAPFKHDDGGLEDLKKAERYVRFAIERIERNGV